MDYKEQIEKQASVTGDMIYDRKNRTAHVDILQEHDTGNGDIVYGQKRIDLNDIINDGSVPKHFHKKIKSGENLALLGLATTLGGLPAGYMAGSALGGKIGHPKIGGVLGGAGGYIAGMLGGAKLARIGDGIRRKAETSLTPEQVSAIQNKVESENKAVLDSIKNDGVNSPYLTGVWNQADDVYYDASEYKNKQAGEIIMDYKEQIEKQAGIKDVVKGMDIVQGAKGIASNAKKIDHLTAVKNRMKAKVRIDADSMRNFKDAINNAKKAKSDSVKQFGKGVAKTTGAVGAIGAGTFGASRLSKKKDEIEKKAMKVSPSVSKQLQKAKAVMASGAGVGIGATAAGVFAASKLAKKKDEIEKKAMAPFVTQGLKAIGSTVGKGALAGSAVGGIGGALKKPKEGESRLGNIANGATGGAIAGGVGTAHATGVTKSIVNGFKGAKGIGVKPVPIKTTQTKLLAK